jgi:hypothetical protein
MTSSMSPATSSPSEPHPVTGQPVGLPLKNPKAGPRPGPVTLKGRYGRLAKLRPDHWSDLWAVFAGHDQVWTYISTAGPFANASEFSASIAMRAAAEDPYAYAIINAQDRAVGYFTLLRIVPLNRVIEVGHVMYSPSLQRTPLGTEAQYARQRMAVAQAQFRALAEPRQFRRPRRAKNQPRGLERRRTGRRTQ